MAGYSFHIPWYATGFRGDKLEAALIEVSAVALKYGATHHAVYRSRDDRYKFTHVVDFPSREQWERYWYGPEVMHFRTVTSGWFQVPILPVPMDISTEGAMPTAGAERAVEGDAVPATDAAA